MQFTAHSAFDDPGTDRGCENDAKHLVPVAQLLSKEYARERAKLYVKWQWTVIEFAEADLTQAGFEIVRKDLSFVKRPAHQMAGGVMSGW